MCNPSELLLRGQHEMHATLRIEPHQPHRRRIQRDRIPARQDDVEAPGLAIGRTAPFHADDAVHDGELRLEDAMEGRQQRIEMLVHENPVVLRQRAPLVFERARKIGQRMRLQHGQGDEDIRIENHLGKLDHPGGIAPDGRPRRFGEIHERDAAACRDLIEARDRERLLRLLPQSVGFPDDDVPGARLQHLADRVGQPRIGVRGLRFVRHRRAAVRFDHHLRVSRHEAFPMTESHAFFHRIANGAIRHAAEHHRAFLRPSHRAPVLSSIIRCHHPCTDIRFLK